jgi:hypothetical protein
MGIQKLLESIFSLLTDLRINDSAQVCCFFVRIYIALSLNVTIWKIQAQIKAFLEQIFHHFDTNRDGHISWEEYRKVRVLFQHQRVTR